MLAKLFSVVFWSVMLLCLSSVHLEWATKSSFCRFEATRKIRERERSINDLILRGEMSGNECYNKSEWHVPILAMTADVIQATQEECTKCGMDGYVSKPFEAVQLYREVSRFFHTSSSQNDWASSSWRISRWHERKLLALDASDLISGFYFAYE